MLINEQDIVLETGIEMRLETQLDDDVVVVAVDVRVHAVQALEHVADQSGERLWKGHADAGREHGFVVYVGLDPGHEVLYVFGRRHFGGFLVGLGVLPEILEPGGMLDLTDAGNGWLTRLLLSSLGSSGGSRIPLLNRIAG